MWKAIRKVMAWRPGRRQRLEAEVRLWLDRSAFELDRRDARATAVAGRR